MAQVFATIVAPAESWLLQGTETARTLMLATSTVLHYNSGANDTLPALTAAAVDGGGTTFDTSPTGANWVAYTTQGSNTLKLAKESALPSAGTWALLAYVTNNAVYPLAQGAAGPPGPAGGGTLLAYTAYRPGSDTSYNTTALFPVDVDAVNFAVTFTAPASGNVLVRLTVPGADNNATQLVYWGLREGSTTVARSLGATIVEPAPVSLALVVTGISAGSHTYKFAWGVQNTGSTFIYVGPTYGQLVMEVWQL